ncbi:MAG: VWA domain-containing protein [Acidimicrobiales bacterium]
MTPAPAFPFSAVVGSDDAKLALLLATIDPRIGGVLLRGDKGSAKTTLARGLASLLPGDAPFVELPLGATEERVVGTIDLAAALTDREVRVQPGLLASADGGVLYVDEVNLLADHLVDVLLDAAASGTNRIERDGLSHQHAARFVLVGSMNPEEGDLRPQLLDRFGLAVDVRAASDPADRVDVVRRRLAFDADPEAAIERWGHNEAALAERLSTCRPADVSDDLLVACSTVALSAGAEGLRADLVLARAAAAHAGWQGRSAAADDDLRAIAHLVLAHRARRHPLDPPDAPPGSVEDALDDALGPPPDDVPEAGPETPEGSDGDPRPEPSADPSRVDAPGAVADVVGLEVRRAQQGQASGRRSPVTADRGRTVGHRKVEGSPSGVAVVPTVVAAAARQAADPRSPGGITAADLREPVREAKTGNLLVLAVDASGSMGASDRMAAVKGALLGLLVDAYQRRDRVALVTFGGSGAEVVLRPTGSVEVARARLEALPTGGDTPLADGLRVAADLATQSTGNGSRPLLVLVTDGRATAGPNPFATAMDAAHSVARRKLPTVVIDVEVPGPDALGLAAPLAEAVGARLLSLPQLTAGRLEAALRGL